MSNDKILSERIFTILKSNNLINEKSEKQFKSELAKGQITTDDWVKFTELQMMEESKSEEE